MTNPRADRDLLAAAVREAGALALARWSEPFEVAEKAPNDPVTEVDLAVNALLADRLRGARPAYGWLSEEGPDDPNRARAQRMFVVDPIDGTRAFIAKKPEFSISVAVVEAGRPIAACVFNPATKELYDASRDDRTRRNGVAVRATIVDDPARARYLGHPRAIDPDLDWSNAYVESRGSVAYRLALVASGAFDAMVSLVAKRVWDVAAGDLLLVQAGARLSGPEGTDLRYDGEDTRTPGLLGAGSQLHKLLLNRLKS